MIGAYFQPLRRRNLNDQTTCLNDIELMFQRPPCDFGGRFYLPDSSCMRRIRLSRINREVSDVRSYSFGFEIQQDVHAPVCFSVSGTKVYQQMQAEQDRQSHCDHWCYLGDTSWKNAEKSCAHGVLSVIGAATDLTRLRTEARLSDEWSTQQILISL